MFEFFTEDSQSVGSGYSIMKCTLTRMGHKHTPHPHGPHVCAGHPVVALYSLPKEVAS